MPSTADPLTTTFAALADPTRRAILGRLAEGEATVNDLAEPFPITTQAVSQHLKVLERAGLITRSRAAQLRPSRLQAARLKDAADWLEKYRPFWDASFDRARRPPAGYSGRDATMAEPHAPEEGLRLTRVFDAPRDEVWREWTEPERFADWYGGRDSEVPLASVSMDVRPGGTWRATMFAGAERREIRWAGEYREVVEPERLVFTVTDEPGGDTVRARVRRAHRPRPGPDADGLRADRWAPHPGAVRAGRAGVVVVLRRCGGAPRRPLGRPPARVGGRGECARCHILGYPRTDASFHPLPSSPAVRLRGLVRPDP